MLMNRVVVAGGILPLGVATTVARQGGHSDESGRVLALKTAWNHAIEAKDTKAIEMLLGDNVVALSSDGSLSNKKEYLEGTESADFQPAQAINEGNIAHVYGDTVVAVGVFRIRGVEKGKRYTHRERTIDTWSK